MTLIQSKQDNFQQLTALKNYIEAKTKHLNTILTVKGKLEMLKNTFDMQNET